MNFYLRLQNTENFDLSASRTKKLLEETTKVDKVLSKFKANSITKTNELFYAGDVVVTNKLVVKIDKVAGRKKPM